MIIRGGVKSPVTTRRGLLARIRYLTTHKGGLKELRDAGITAADATIRAWAKGTQRPRPANAEKIDSAYWTLRARNVLANPAGLKAHLNREGRGTTVEIHPVNQAPVIPTRRRDIATRTLQVRYVWDDAVDAVDALAAGDTDKLEEIWDDIIADMDSDWGAYTYVSHIGLGA